MRRVTLADFDRPDSAWNHAAAHSEQADPFACRTEWQLSFHEEFYPSRPLHLFVGSDSALALAEGQDQPVLEPLESHWLFGCPLVGPHAVDLLEAFLHGEAARSATRGVVLGGLLPGSPLLAEVTRRFRSGHAIGRLRSGIMRCASLAGGLDGYLARRSGKMRRQLRQAARRANDRGVTFERCVPHGNAESADTYARMLAVERTSWKGLGHCGMAEPPARGFYAAMLRRLAVAGTGRVMFARCGERDIGFIFGGLVGTVYRGQQFSYAEDWQTASIGSLLQLEQLRWLCEEGSTRYDMGPEMDYKRHWTEIEILIVVWLLWPTR